MSVAPHPHTGLQTVSWLFTGEIEHRDSAGHHAMVRPGRAQPDDRRPRHQPLRGLDAGDHRRCTAPSCGWRCRTTPATATPASSTTRPPPVTGAGWDGAGVPRLAARLDLAGRHRHPAARAPSCSSSAGADAATLDVDPSYEHGVLVDTGVVSLDGVEAKKHELAYLPPGSQRLSHRRPHAAPGCCCSAARRSARPIVMWWNFVGPHPRGGGRLPRGVAGAARGRRGTPTAGSASRPATTCRRSRRPRCPTPG